MEQEPLWKTLIYTTAALSVIAAVTTTVKAIRSAAARSKEWLAEQITKGSSMRTK